MPNTDYSSCVTADGTFVETSSGPAARGLKKLYDQQLGVGMSVRSPYAITAFINQHGKEMYRIGSVNFTATCVTTHAKNSF
jgi:GDP/GTP exchange factor required for growth at low temperature